MNIIEIALGYVTVLLLAGIFAFLLYGLLKGINQEKETRFKRRRSYR
jgi:hypothetical protein